MFYVNLMFLVEIFPNMQLYKLQQKQTNRQNIMSSYATIINTQYLAIIHSVLAIFASESSLADTWVPADLVHTQTIVLTRVVGTVVDVNVAVSPSPSRLTYTFISTMYKE